MPLDQDLLEWSLRNGDFHTAAKLLRTADEPSPLLQVKNDGSTFNITCTTGVWVDTDPLGTAASRPLDIVYTGVKAGQWVSLYHYAYFTSAAGALTLRFASIVNGVAVNTPNIIPSYGATANVVYISHGTSDYQLQASDIVNPVNGVGSARFRVQHQGTTGVTRSIVSGLFGILYIVGGRGPFG